LKLFDKWGIDFLGPINPPTKRSGVRYIITMTKYLTIWAKVAPIKDCNVDTATCFLILIGSDKVWMPNNVDE
jgi:hypothetical protein